MDLIGKKVLFDVQLPPASESKSQTPVLLSFPSGHFTSENDTVFQLTQKKSGTKIKQTLQLESNGISYSGSDFGSSGVLNDSCNFAIGVYDPSSNSMKVIPANHAYVMNHVYPASNSTGTTTAIPAAERRKALTEAFGSRKRQRAARDEASNVISIDNVSGASIVESNMMDSAAKLVEQVGAVTDAAKVALEEQRQNTLPKFNINAIELSDAYPLEFIITDSLKEQLEQLFEEKLVKISDENIQLENKEAWIGHFFPTCSGDFIKSLISDKIVQNMTKHKKSTRQNISKIFYLDFLLQFYKLTNIRGSVTKSNLITQMNINEPILDQIVNNFSVGGKSNAKVIRNKDMGQKILLFAYALGLHITDFRLDLTILAQDLKSSLPVLGNIARALGCSVVKAKDGTFAELRLPLTFPDPSRGKR